MADLHKASSCSQSEPDFSINFTPASMFSLRIEPVRSGEHSMFRLPRRQTFGPLGEYGERTVPGGYSKMG